MFKTIDDIMYMTDGNNPFREGLLYGRGGLGYKPTPYNMVGGMIGGLTNYNRKGEIVEQKENNGDIENYKLTPETIDTNIINNNELTEDEKNNQLLTTFYELISLEKIAKTAKDTLIIQELKDYLRNELSNEEYENKIDPKIENTIIKKTEKIIKGENQPLYTEAANINYNEILEKFKNAFDNKDIEKIEDLMEDYGILKKNLKDIIFKNPFNNTLVDNFDENRLLSILSNKHNTIRGNNSEDIVIPKEVDKKHNDMLIKIFSGDFGNIYNSKDDRAYHPDYFKKVFDEIEKKLNYKLNNENKEYIKQTIQQKFPIDGIGDDNLYELKSRNKNVFNPTESATYNKTKLLSSGVYLNKPIDGNNLKFYFTYIYNTDGTKLKNIKTSIEFNNDAENTSKDILTLKSNKNGYNLNWTDIDKNGTVFLDPLNLETGVIDSNTLNNRKEKVLKSINDMLEDINIKKNKGEEKININDILMKSGNKPSLDEDKISNILKKKYKITDEDIKDIFEYVKLDVNLDFSPNIKKEYLSESKSESETAKDDVLFKFEKGIKQNPIQNFLYNQNKKDWVRRTYTSKKK